MASAVPVISIPSYDGTGNFDEWCRRFRRVALGNNWSPEKWPHFASAYFSGKAEDLWYDIPEDEIPTSWTAFVQDFRKHFLSYPFNENHQTSLKKKKQGGGGAGTPVEPVVLPPQTPSYQQSPLPLPVPVVRMHDAGGIHQPIGLAAYHAHKLLGIPPPASSSEGTSICAYLLTFISVLLIIVTFPVSLFFCVKVVQEYERAVIFRLGRLLRGGAKGPGIFFIIPCIDTYCKVDLRTVSFDVPPQEILSRDSVTVAVDAVVYYRISNATIAVSNVEDYGHSTRLLAATNLRNVLGTKLLSEILSERESISHVMQSCLDEATDPWGVKVERVEIKDVRLPVQLQRAMAAEAEAAREARAKVIAAEGEQRASRALKEAADVMVDTPAALQLRYLQTLSSIAAEKNSTIVFPIPMELFNGFLTKPH